ncbi:MAG: glycosyltransferase [Flavobacteriales bacterium]|jgi:rSAM/selenodomain-associated transferase 1|nr:glycosyltransferase [Candidatus Arcticimaribacter sp.]|tara:strand:- start:763 stop:1368 length:606 start_codon:yes stop_codon:yes gene_type:complete
MRKKLLLIFTKNPQLGKVKTRLAKTIGDEKALFIFNKLVSKTSEVVEKVNVHKSLYYSDFVDDQDIWEGSVSDKSIQEGNCLGERMANAFKKGFDDGFNRIIVIGTDLWNLDTQIINKAFAALKNKDGVIGPATDGGYYLLGLSKWIPQVFDGKNWGTSSVLDDTLTDFKNNTLVQLETKNDVDYFEDLKANPELLQLLDQ